jgi:hypothetical protein
MRLRQWILVGLSAAFCFASAVSQASAQESRLDYLPPDYVPGADFSIACENGANYRLSSGPAVFPGDIVTARLHLSPRHALPVRLMPMGMGYRYAGRGVWLDGIREHALLYLSKYRPVACIVSRV